jgi:hypothetical protein
MILNNSLFDMQLQTLVLFGDFLTIQTQTIPSTTNGNDTRQDGIDNDFLEGGI